MFLEVALIICLIVGIKGALIDSFDYPALNIFGWIFIIISIVTLPFNTIEMLTVEYDYEMMVAERNAYQSTLNGLREINNEFETLAIGTDIIEFNKNLAKEKVQNESWFYGPYIDDRIINIKPVK
jgi:predicted signal transduction protein with EAL and GGDEF domain